MEVKVQIISKETIRPSSPTPSHLRTHKLSILDQLAPMCYIPIILFYPATDQNFSKTSDHLKKSLAETLTHFYPLAGRVKNGSYIDCNDDGSTYIEAHVASDASKVLKNPDIGQLLQLLPCNSSNNFVDIGDQEILAIQVNYFTCGGIAIGVCFHHVAVDASSIATFVTSWAAIACGVNGTINGAIFDCTSLFPPKNTADFSWRNYMDEDIFLKTVTKRFVFEGSQIAALRERVGNGPYLDRPTRFEAISALIWGSLIAATRDKDKSPIKDLLVLLPVDLRKRMNPPLPEHCMGNIWQGTIANCSIENTINYNELAGKIRKSIRMMTDDYVKKLHVEGYFNFIKSGAEQFLRSDIELFVFSSWCKFPFYEADFGYGKPTWVGAPFWQNIGAIFLDAPDGEGIEAWVGLAKEDMAQLEQNPEILEYASFHSSI